MNDHHCKVDFQSFKSSERNHYFSFIEGIFASRKMRDIRELPISIEPPKIPESQIHDLMAKESHCTTTHPFSFVIQWKLNSLIE